MKLDKLTNIQEIVKSTTIKIADTEELMDKAFEIRYKAYRSKKCIKENKEERCYDKYDFLPNSTTFLAILDTIPVGTIRAVVRYPDKKEATLPLEEVFSDDIKEIIKKKTVIIESCKYCILPEYQKEGLKISLPLFKSINWIAIKEDATDILTVVRKKHIKFYKDVLSFEPISSKEKKYPGLEYYALVLGLNCKEDQIRRKKEYPESYNYYYKEEMPWH